MISDLGDVAKLTLESVVARGCAMAEFCARVRERGGVAVVEEREDLPVLRCLYIMLLVARRRSSGAR
jgi:hypothetical protein